MPTVRVTVYVYVYVYVQVAMASAVALLSSPPVMGVKGQVRYVYVRDCVCMCVCVCARMCSRVAMATGHTNTVTSCQMNAERNIVVSTSMDQTTAIWDMRMPHRLLISLKYVMDCMEWSHTFVPENWMYKPPRAFSTNRCELSSQSGLSSDTWMILGIKCTI